MSTLPDPRTLDTLLAVAAEAADAGGRTALAWQKRRHLLTVEEKAGPADLVSQADRDAEEAVLEVLAARRPDDAVLAEESGASGGPARDSGEDGVRWVVDPIDGTTNYLYGRVQWAVSVAAVRASDGLPLAGVVFEPVTGRVTAARRGGGTTSNDVPVRIGRVDTLREAVVEVGLGRPPFRARAGRLLDELVPRVRDVRRSGSAAIALAEVATGRVDACWSPGLEPWDCAAGVLLVHEAGGVVGDLDGQVAGVPRHVLAGGLPLVEQLRTVLRGVFTDLDIAP